MTNTFKVGDKIKVVKNYNKHLPFPPGVLGKEGKIVGSLTDNSCRVKVAYADEVWVEFREIELIKASKESPVAKTQTRRRKT